MTDRTRETARRSLSAAAAAESLEDFGVADLPQRQLTARAVRAGVAELERRQSFLAAIETAAATAADPTDLGERVTRLVLPRLGEWALLDVLDDDGRLGCLASTHVDAARAPLAGERRGEVVESADGTICAVALSTARARIGLVDADGDASGEGVAGHDARLLRLLGIRSYIAQPIISRGRTLGVLTVLSTVPTRYSVEQLNLSGAVAQRIAAALDSLLLLEALHETRAERRAADGRLRAMATALDAMLWESAPEALTYAGVVGGSPTPFGFPLEKWAEAGFHASRVAPEDQEAFAAAHAAASVGRGGECEYRLLAADGVERWVREVIRTERGEDGRPVWLRGVIEDITSQITARERLEESEHFTRTIVASVGEGVIVYDRDLRCRVWNSFMESLTGRGASQVLGLHALDVTPQLREFGLERLLERALAGETVSAPDTPYRIPETGRGGWVSGLYSPHLALNGEIVGVVAILHDVTERKRAEEKLIHSAFHDALTGLPNRALFVDRLERLLHHGSRHPGYSFAVAFLDVDRFKVVNDSLGHLVGDELLIAVGRRLEGSLRLGDTVARLGGDEFAILLDDVPDAGQATRVAHRLQAAFEEPFDIAGQEIFVAASIGIALSATGYERPDDILRDADTAMYRAKAEGRARYEIFDRHMHERAVHQLQLETDLRRAIERNELSLYYQPIVDLAGGHLVGFEALLRWHHPVRGMISPVEFIPIAEDTGLIIPIGAWVLREACRQGAQWDREFPDRKLSVSVNLSGRQFAQPDLPARLDRVLAETGFDARRLRLEITESAVMQNAPAVPGMLAALHARGIQLCLDDFGTGYSSLSYLHSFPLDTLKIDKSFVSRITSGTRQFELVQTIVSLGRSLGMDAVAEGVETREQLETLRKLAPRHVQGFYFAPPLPPADAAALVRDDVRW